MRTAHRRIHDTAAPPISWKTGRAHYFQTGRRFPFFGKSGRRVGDLFISFDFATNAISPKVRARTNAGKRKCFMHMRVLSHWAVQSNRATQQSQALRSQIGEKRMPTTRPVSSLAPETPASVERQLIYYRNLMKTGATCKPETIRRRISELAERLVRLRANVQGTPKKGVNW